MFGETISRILKITLVSILLYIITTYIVKKKYEDMVLRQFIKNTRRLNFNKKEDSVTFTNEKNKYQASKFRTMMIRTIFFGIASFIAIYFIITQDKPIYKERIVYSQRTEPSPPQTYAQPQPQQQLQPQPQYHSQMMFDVPQF